MTKYLNLFKDNCLFFLPELIRLHQSRHLCFYLLLWQQHRFYGVFQGWCDRAVCRRTVFPVLLLALGRILNNHRRTQTAGGGVVYVSADSGAGIIRPVLPLQPSETLPHQG